MGFLKLKTSFKNSALKGYDFKLSFKPLHFLLCFLVYFSLLFFSSALAQTSFEELDDLRAKMGSISDKNSKFYEAKNQKLQKLIKKNEIDYSISYRMADIKRLISEKKFVAAKFELNDLIDNNGNNVDKSLCFELLGDIAQELRDDNKVIVNYYKLALEPDENNINARFKLARVYFENGKNILGLEHLSYIVKMAQDEGVLEKIENFVKYKTHPKDKFEANNLYEILGNIYLKQKKYEPAFRAFDTAIQLNPDDIYIKYLLVELIYNYKHKYNSSQFARAIKICDEIISQNKDSQIKNIKAKMLPKNVEGNGEKIREKNREKSEQISRADIEDIIPLTQNIVQTPVQNIVQNTAQKPAQSAVQKTIQKTMQKTSQKPAVKDGNKKYIDMLKAYEEIEPKTASIYQAISNTYKLLNDKEQALVNLKKAYELEPVNPDINYDLGLLYFELNSPKSAKKYLVQTLNFDKDNKKAKNLLAFVNQKIVTTAINKAFGEFENKNYIAALEILDAAIIEFNRNSQLYYYRALVYDAMNRNGAQIIDLQKSIEFDPTNYMSYYQLGLAYEKIKDERSALVAYERFLSIEPEEADLVYEVEQKVINLAKKYY